MCPALQTSFFNESRSFQGVKGEPKDYAEIARDRLFIEEELSQLLEVLKKEANPSEQFWVYCYYLSLMLQTYYKAYGKLTEANRYERLAEDIEQHYRQGHLPPTIFKDWKQQLIEDLTDIASAPAHISRIRDWAAFTNITRMQVVFSKLTLAKSLAAIQGTRLETFMSRVFGQTSSAGSMISNLDKTAGVLNVLSVGVFAVRFAINAGMLLKHTVIPGEEEKTLPLKERFKQELSKRHCDMLNDLGWGTVNGITNYAAYFKLSAPAAGWIMAGFIPLDLSLFFYRYYLAERTYSLKKADYQTELNATQDPERRRILNAQMDELEFNWRATKATHWFNVTADLLLILGFTASLLFAMPAALPVSFFICVIGISMLISANLFGDYREKSLRLAQLENSQDATTNALKDALQEKSKARETLLLSLVKNALIPALIMAVFAVSWPAAVVLTVLFISYECTKGYFKSGPELPPPDESEELQGVLREYEPDVHFESVSAN